MTEEKTPVLKAAGSGPVVRTELLAGLTTFLSMAYILALYPGVMSKIGLPAGGAVIAAALAAALGTFLMGFLAMERNVVSPASSSVLTAGPKPAAFKTGVFSSVIFSLSVSRGRRG